MRNNSTRPPTDVGKQRANNDPRRSTRLARPIIRSAGCEPRPGAKLSSWAELDEMNGWMDGWRDGEMDERMGGRMVSSNAVQAQIDQRE